jgi:hypothetical protein
VQQRVDDRRGVEHGVGDDFAPGKGVADAAVERVGPVLVEAEDVRGVLDAGQLAEPPGDARADQDERQPGHDLAIRAVGEQRERDRAGGDEENPDPDRPVRQAVARLVFGAKDTIGGKFNPLGVSVTEFVRRW